MASIIMATSPSLITYEIEVRDKRKTPGGLDLVRELLKGQNIPLTHIVELTKQGRLCLCIYLSAREQVDQVITCLDTLLGVRLSIHLNSLVPADWQDVWKKTFNPFNLSSTFKVIPVWLKETTVVGKKTSIYMDTTLAFGTGLHETTRFMVGFIEKCQGHFKTFLDIGSGTGILSMVAWHCGAQQVKGFDISPEAVEVAQNNCRENFNEFVAITFKKGNIHRWRAQQTYDFVAANLITYDLLKAAAKIVRCVAPGKYLALSGVSLENIVVIQEAFKIFPLRCLRIKRGQRWAAFLFKRTV